MIDFFSQALEIYRRQGDQFSEHLCLSDLAGAYLSRGDLRRGCSRRSTQCLAFFSSIGALDDAPTCLYTRGEIYRRMGRMEEALESLHASLALCTRLDRSAAADFQSSSYRRRRCATWAATMMHWTMLERL